MKDPFKRALRKVFKRLKQLFSGRAQHTVEFWAQALRSHPVPLKDLMAQLHGKVGAAVYGEQQEEVELPVEGQGAELPPSPPSLATVSMQNWAPDDDVAGPPIMPFERNFSFSVPGIVAPRPTAIVAYGGLMARAAPNSLSAPNTPGEEMRMIKFLLPAVEPECPQPAMVQLEAGKGASQADASQAEHSRDALKRDKGEAADDLFNFVNFGQQTPAATSRTSGPAAATSCRASRI